MSKAARVLVVVGSVAILVGAIDPVEGIFLIFPGSGLIALGAYLAQAPRRRLVYCGLFLIAAGFLATMIASFIFHGIEGAWLLLLLPYPVGWIMDVFGVAFVLTGLFKGPWGHFAGGIWLLAACGVLTLLATKIVQADLLGPWTMAGVAALSCISALAVYASEKRRGADPHT